MSKIKFWKGIYHFVDKLLPAKMFRKFNIKIRVFFTRRISPSISKKAFIYKGARIMENVFVDDFGNIGFNAIVSSNVTIGKNVMMGENCSMFTVYHRRMDDGTYSGYCEPKPIFIGDNCWIGHNVIILGGVSIGKNVTIGAGSVVTNDVPDNCLVAGNPAVIKKYYE